MKEEVELELAMLREHVDSLAALLGVTPAAVRGWIKGGELVSVELGNRRRILRRDLERFLARNRVTHFRVLRTNQYARHAETPAEPGPEYDFAGGDNIPFDDSPGR
jgi:excisionase family DNA binding protein